MLGTTSTFPRLSRQSWVECLKYHEEEYQETEALTTPVHRIKPSVHGIAGSVVLMVNK